MPGLDHLIDKILSDAGGEAKRVTAAGQQEAASVVAGYERRAQAEKAGMLNKAAAEAAARRAQLISAAEMAARDRKLEAKQRLMEKVFAAAAQKLGQMDDARYAMFLSKQLSGAELPEDTEIVVPSRYREKLDLSNIHPRLRLSGSDRRCESGFILVSPDSESNNTFEALIRTRRNELEKLVAERLF